MFDGEFVLFDPIEEPLGEKSYEKLDGIREFMKIRRREWNRRRTKRCPVCYGVDVVPIVYGYPGGELFKQEMEGKIRLGGCCITGNDPDLYCNECGMRFKKGEGLPPIVFEYSDGPTFIIAGSSVRRQITVFDDGQILERRYLHLFNDDMPVYAKFHYPIASPRYEIGEIIKKYQSEIDQMPDVLESSMLDGPMQEFRFGDKSIITFISGRMDLKELKKQDPALFHEYEENIRNENKILDIFKEIAEVLKENEIEVDPLE